MCLVLLFLLQIGRFIVVPQLTDEPADLNRPFYIAQIIDPKPTANDLSKGDIPSEWIKVQFWSTKATSKTSYGFGMWQQVKVYKEDGTQGMIDEVKVISFFLIIWTLFEQLT